jgi:hypothetical protein
MARQAILDRAITRKEAIIAKKAIKTAKPSYIIILKLKSSLLASLGSYEQVVVENQGTEAMRGP